MTSNDYGVCTLSASVNLKYVHMLCFLSIKMKDVPVLGYLGDVCSSYILDFY